MREPLTRTIAVSLVALGSSVALVASAPSAEGGARMGGGHFAHYKAGGGVCDPALCPGVISAPYRGLYGVGQPLKNTFNGPPGKSPTSGELVEAPAPPTIPTGSIGISRHHGYGHSYGFGYVGGYDAGSCMEWRAIYDHRGNYLGRHSVNLCD